MSNITERDNIIDGLDDPTRFPDNSNQEITAERQRNVFAEILAKLAILINLNELAFGDDDAGSTDDIILKFERGGGNFFAIKANRTTNTLQFSNDGVTFQNLGSGGVSGLTDGSILIFDGVGDEVTENNAQFFFNNLLARMGLGTNTPTGKLEIVGSEDVVQLIVQAFTGQTSALTAFKDALGNILEELTPDGDKQRRGSDNNPTANADSYVEYGADYKGNPGQKSPRSKTEDGFVIDHRFAAEEPKGVILQQFANIEDIEFHEGSRIGIIDIIFDFQKISQLEIGAVTHGALDLDAPAFQPSITNGTTKANAISDLNAWLDGSNTIDGNAYTSPTQDEIFSLRTVATTFNGNYTKANVYILYYLK